MKRDLYAEVSTRIVAELEHGAAPWIKPWSATAGMNTPCNAATDRPYSGSNVVLLWMAQTAGYRTPRFLTFKQALELGGNVRKGVRGREQEMRRVAQRQSSELQKDQSTRPRQRGCEGRSSTFAMVDLASVPCTSRLSTGRRRSRASEARRGCAAHPRAGSRSSFFG